jgi:hypothetical protein
VVVQDEYGPALATALRERPADEPIVDALLASLRGPLGAMLQQERSERAIAEIIAERAERAGRDAFDLEIKCAAAAIIGVFTALVRHWVDGDGKEDLADLYERHLPLLSWGLAF